MRAGELRHRITIQKPVEVKDEYKTIIDVGWQDFATVWAAVEPVRGSEYIQLQNSKSELTVRVRIRYLAGVNDSMRILYGGRILYINSPPIDVDGRHREMELMCVEDDG
jgi:SPP1 family predicted phage head-tail adaptor